MSVSMLGLSVMAGAGMVLPLPLPLAGFDLPISYRQTNSLLTNTRIGIPYLKLYKFSTPLRTIPMKSLVTGRQKNKLQLFCVTVLALAFQSVSATSIPDAVCIDSPPTGDGWGWDGTNSCSVPAAVVADTCIDTEPQNDGWGWDGLQSCRIIDPAAIQTNCFDPDGDGWGWDGSSSCLVTAAVDDPPADDQPIGECIDSDGDGWGWNGTQSCLTESVAQPSFTCVDNEPVGDTWGWNGVASCRIPPVLVGGDTSAIAGVYAIDDPESPEDVEYLEIGSNGSFTTYYKYSGSDCFYAEASSEGNSRVAITSLGTDLYQFDSYSYTGFTFEDGSVNDFLEVDTPVIYSMFITADNALAIELVDSGGEDFELAPVSFPSVDVDLQALALCPIFE